VELYDGMAFSIIRSTDVVRARDEPKGNHRWLGVCSVTGPGVPAGAEIAELSICDVAPMVLHGLGLEIPEGLDGRLPPEVFPDAALRPLAETDALPGEFAEPAHAAVGPATPVYDSESEAVVLARLRSLGYLD
jgi:hypothetical protein